jgi:hypothetical protein
MAVLLLVFVIRRAAHRRGHLPRDPAHRTVAANSLIRA